MNRGALRPWGGLAIIAGHYGRGRTSIIAGHYGRGAIWRAFLLGENVEFGAGGEVEAVLRGEGSEAEVASALWFLQHHALEVG